MNARAQMYQVELTHFPAQAKARTLRIQASELEPLSIGSSPGNDLPIQANSLARRHARVAVFRGEAFVVCDDPSCRVLVHGKPLPHEGYSWLVLGEAFVLGQERFELQLRPVEVVEASAGVDRSRTLTDLDFFLEQELRQMVQEAPRNPPRLVVIDGPQVGLCMDLDASQKILIGRGASCDLRLSDIAIAREQAYVQRQGERTVLCVLDGGRHKLLVDGQRRPDVRELELTHGMQIRLGRQTLLFCDVVQQQIHSAFEESFARVA